MWINLQQKMRLCTLPRILAIGNRARSQATSLLSNCVNHPGTESHTVTIQRNSSSVALSNAITCKCSSAPLSTTSYTTCRQFTTSSIHRAAEDKTISFYFKDYYSAVENEVQTNPRIQYVTKAQELTEDPDVKEKAIKRWMFNEAVDVYIERNGKMVKRSTEFILDAMKKMKEVGVHRDLSCYKALVKVFPEEVMVAKTNWQVEFKHFPRHQDCALEILEQMELYGVIPDMDIGNQLVNVFGTNAHVIRKFRRTVYWMRKFANRNPYKLPLDLPLDALQLALLALKKMSIDLGNELKVWKAKEELVAKETVFIASAQSEAQRSLIATHPIDMPLYVEGAFTVWLRDVTQTYYILRADSDPKLFRQPTQEEEDEDLFEFETIFDSETPKELVPRLSDHQQEDGTILGMCITETGSKDSLINWIRCLQESCPRLEKIPIVFSLQTPEDAIVPADDKDETTSPVVTNKS